MTVKKSKELEWIERLKLVKCVVDEDYDEEITDIGRALSTRNLKRLVDFIQSLLTQQRTELNREWNIKLLLSQREMVDSYKNKRTELLEEIEAIVEEQLFWYKGEDYGSITAREALNQVKNLLNKKD